MKRFANRLAIGLLLFLAAGCNPAPSITADAPLATLTPQAVPAIPILDPSVTSEPSAIVIPAETVAPSAISSLTSTPETRLRFAVIGDYGLAGQAEADVAALVLSWQPDIILTTGDNNYPDGAADTIDANIGQYYHSYISPYKGDYGPGAEQNRFFPSLGNHDWNTDQAQAYFDYFELPGNERYYDFVLGPVHFFALDSDSREPDGVGRSSLQAGWLQERLAGSSTPWQIVFMHHPPYSSGLHGPVDWMRWPFAQWGADAVLAGHDHLYERLHTESGIYFINGLGGGPIYYFMDVDQNSVMRYNDDYGAMLVEASSQQITFQFITRAGQVIDELTLLSPQ